MFAGIEVGRVTLLNQKKPYLATVNAVAIPNNARNYQQKPLKTFHKSFDDLELAKAFATSFFAKDAQQFITWTIYQ